MPDILLRPRTATSTLREALARRGRRVALASREVVHGDAIGFEEAPRHVIGTTAVENVLALSSQQTYHDGKYRLVLGSARLDVPKRKPVPRQRKRTKRWQRPATDKRNPNPTTLKRLPAVWKTSTLPAVQYRAGNLSTVSVKTRKWNSPWQRYRGSWHQQHVPASKSEQFHHRGYESQQPAASNWGRAATFTVEACPATLSRPATVDAYAARIAEHSLDGAHPRRLRPEPETHRRMPRRIPQEDYSSQTPQLE